MELTLESLERVICKVNSTDYSVDLIQILETVEYKKLEDFFEGVSEGSWELHTKVSQAVMEGVVKCQVHGKDEELVLVLSVGLKLLNKGIENIDIQSVLRFAYLNIYLKAQISVYLEKVSVTDECRQQLSEKIMRIFSNINFQISVLPGAPQHEIDIKLKGDRAIEDGNVNGYYQFIESLQGGGNSQRIPQVLQELFSFLFDFNFDLCQEYINSFPSPISYIHFFAALKSDQLVKLGKSAETNNGWVLFEILNALSKRQSTTLSDLMADIMAEIIDKLSQISPDFYAEAISFFNLDPTFNAALGWQLASKTKHELVAIVKADFVVSEFNHNKKVKNLLLASFKNRATEEGYLHFVGLVFEKWEEFLAAKLLDNDFYSNDVVETEYYNYVLEHYLFNVTEDYIVEQALELIDKLTWIESGWFKSISNLQAAFSIHFTKLFTISIAYSKRKMASAAIHHSVARFQKLQILRKRYLGQPYYWVELSKNFSLIEK